MKREHDLQLRLRSLQTLQQAVSAMKSLSAHHFREARRALEPARLYHEGVDRMLRSTGAWLPAGDGAVGLLVIGAELGFCGAYNSRIVEAAVERRRTLGEGPTICLGHRASRLLSRSGVAVSRSYTGPTSVGGLTDTLLTLAQDIVQIYRTDGLSRFEVIASEFEGVGAYEAATTTLLPVHIERDEDAPVPRYVASEHIQHVAVRELLYIMIYDVLLEALTAEHGARLAATQGAERWLGERTDDLRRSLSAARREASTQEVIEIAAGARARPASDQARRA